MISEELTLRRAVVCGSGLLYWIGVAVQVKRIRARIGRSPNVKPAGAKEKFLWFGWFVVILVWIGQPLLLGTTTAMILPGLALMTILLRPAALVIGLAMVTLGYAGTLWTYAVMGNNWRMGVNVKEKTALVCGGPFHWVRHPIYLLQVIMLAGAALLLPTPISFVTVAVHYVCVRFKARDEERYLMNIHGNAYSDYCSHTGGLFPRLIGRPTVANDTSATCELISKRDRRTSAVNNP